MLKLSIIIPVYNLEGYLAKCLDSVIHPGLEDYEVIVVNDGSTDRSEEIAAGYARRYPQLVRLITTANGGLGAARNVGIDAAAGEFLLFLDSDDYLTDNAVPEILETLKEAFDICIFDIASVNQKGALIKYMPGCDREGEASLAIYPQLLMQPPAACNKLCRRDLFTGNDIRFPGRVWFEDLHTMPKLYLCAERIISVRRPWYNYLQRAGSITNAKKTERNMEIIDAVDDVLQFYRERGKYEEYKAELEYMAFYNQFLTSSVRVNLADYRSSVQDRLMEDFTAKFPGYRENPYIKSMPAQHRLLSFLLAHRQRLAVNWLMRLNNRIKQKDL